MIREIKERGLDHCKIITVKENKKVFFITIDNSIVYRIKTNYDKELINYSFSWYSVPKEIIINPNDILSEFRVKIEHEIILLIDYYVF